MQGDAREGLKVIDNELQNIGEKLAEIKLLVKNVQETQTYTTERLTRMEERQTNQAAAVDRAFTSIKDQEARIQRIEIEQPLTKTVRNYAIAGVLTVLCSVGAFVWNSAQTKQQVIVVDRDGSSTTIRPPNR